MLRAFKKFFLKQWPTKNSGCSPHLEYSYSGRGGRKSGGFTLMELIVSLSIFGLLVTFSVVNFRGFERDITLDLRSEEIASLLRQAQLWSLTGQLRGGSRPPGGYGIRIDQCSTGPCTVIFFADFSPLGSGASRIYNALEDDEILVLNLPKHLIIENVSPDVNLDILFSSPEAAGYIEGGQVEDFASFDITNSVSGTSRSILVDRVSGQIGLN